MSYSAAAMAGCLRLFVVGDACCLMAEPRNANQDKHQSQRPGNIHQAVTYEESCYNQSHSDAHQRYAVERIEKAFHARKIKKNARYACVLTRKILPLRPNFRAVPSADSPKGVRGGAVRAWQESYKHYLLII